MKEGRASLRVPFRFHYAITQWCLPSFEAIFHSNVEK